MNSRSSAISKLSLFAAIWLLALAGCDTSDTPNTTASEPPITASIVATPEKLAPTDSASIKADTAANAAPATVLVLGDSISAAYGIQREKGWVTLLEQHLRSVDEEFTVVNASISGETTGGGLARFDQVLAQHQPEVTIIELGGNDGLRGYPLKQVKSNLLQLVQMAKSAESRVLLLGMQIPPNYGARYSAGFADLFAEVAQSEDVALVPSFLEKVALTPGMLQADGIHPVADAQPLLLSHVLPTLSALLPKT